MTKDANLRSSVLDRELERRFWTFEASKGCACLVLLFQVLAELTESFRAGMVSRVHRSFQEMESSAAKEVSEYVACERMLHLGIRFEIEFLTRFR